MALYLGFDSGTQSLTATIIDIEDDRREIVFEETLIFDEALPEYNTRHGVLPSPDPRIALAPPIMWAAALDRMAAIIARSGLDLSRLRAISGSAQQHGSVYLTERASVVVGSLDPLQPIPPQITQIFARDVSPIWLDCSTGRECGDIAAAVGGDAALAALTGSRAYERFTAAQIRKVALTEPDAYARTDRVHLVSSFLATLLAGEHAPLEPADASGMNLMDLTRRRWAPTALGATAPDLERRLPPIRESWSVIGTLSDYWQKRYGFPPSKLVPWSGDNPSSLIGLGVTDAGQLAISLGTSDTVFGPTDPSRTRPALTGHLFASPTGGEMALVCFANGSLARERVRDLYGLDWSGFSACLQQTPPGNGGALMLPWFGPEITPTAPAGVQRRALDAADAPRNVRAVVEGQMMAMRAHSRWIASSVRTIRAAGGAAVNPEILQVMADVFDADVTRIRPRNAAALGAALRAYHADARSEGRPVSWSGMASGFLDSMRETRMTPCDDHVAVYARLLPQYEAFEARALRTDSRRAQS